MGRDDGLIAPGASPDDPVVPDPAASYDRAASRPFADADERAVVSVQIGRPARGRSAVVHRCAWGLPTVVRVDPRLPDGTPFPTVFWQTCPALRSRIGQLEADRSMVGINERLDGDRPDDVDFATEHAAAQERYRDFRDELGGELPGDPYAGGSPKYVKCLHVHAGHELATNDSPVGCWTVEAARPVPCQGPCVTPEDLDDHPVVAQLRRAEAAEPDPVADRR
nr:DUF501 domain-containing protein [Salsipaludibacter albus]